MPFSWLVYPIFGIVEKESVNHLAQYKNGVHLLLFPERLCCGSQAFMRVKQLFLEDVYPALMWVYDPLIISDKKKYQSFIKMIVKIFTGKIKCLLQGFQLTLQLSRG